MSDTSRISTINVISWILGSGLIAFAINTIYTDYVKQANLDFNVRQVSAINDSIIDTDIYISNSGIETAKNIILTIESIDGDIFEPKVAIQPLSYNENITIKKSSKSIALGERVLPSLLGLKNSTWIVNISNITSHGAVQLRTFLNLTSPAKIMTLSIYIRYEGGFESGIYLLGERFHELYSSKSLFGILSKSLSYVNITLALIAFTSPYIYRRMKNFLDKRNQTKFVIGIINEISTIKEDLKNSGNCEKIFSFDVWKSMCDESKQKIINNYNDYAHINNFYKELTWRNLDIKYNGINSRELKIHNEKALLLANEVFGNKGINWTKYYIHDKKMNSFLTIGLIVGGSLLVFLPMELST